MAESNDNNLISFIAGTVETIRDEVATIRDETATKSQLDASTTAIRGDVEQVHLRMESIEHAVSSSNQAGRRRTKPAKERSLSPEQGSA